jgi:hypothetical protein
VPGLAVTFVDGTDGVTVTGVNDAGDVIGRFANGGAEVRIHQGVVEDLGSCRPLGINNAGQIACAVALPCTGSCVSSTPGIYSSGTLTTPFGTTSGQATGINEAGAILGYTYDPTNSYRVFVRTADGAVSYRPQGPSWGGWTYDLNASLDALVQDAAQLYPTATIQRATGTISLVCDYGRRVTKPSQLDDAGDAVGTCMSPYMGSNHGGGARVWRAATQWKPEMPSYGAQDATGISEDSHVTGNGDDGPFVWHDGRYTILSQALADAGWTLTSAAAISRNGKVAAIGEHTSGKKGVVLIDVATLP